MARDTINPREAIAASEAKISAKLAEMTEIPKGQIPGIVTDLKWYLGYRKLFEKSEQNPSDTSLYNEAQDVMLENFDLFDALNDQYGLTPDITSPKWSVEELETLIEKLEKK